MLSKISSKDDMPKATINDVLVNFLKNQSREKNSTRKERKKKLNVIPGRSVAVEDSIILKYPEIVLICLWSFLLFTYLEFVSS